MPASQPAAQDTASSGADSLRRGQSVGMAAVLHQGKHAQCGPCTQWHDLQVGKVLQLRKAAPMCNASALQHD